MLAQFCKARGGWGGTGDQLTSRGFKLRDWLAQVLLIWEVWVCLVGGHLYVVLALAGYLVVTTGTFRLSELLLRRTDCTSAASF